MEHYMSETAAKTPQETRAYWLTGFIFVDHAKRCWVAMTDDTGQVRQTCIGSEGTVKPALIKASLIEGPKKRGRKPKAKVEKAITPSPGGAKIAYKN